MEHLDKTTDKHTLQFLESLRYIAQQGLHYATGDAYDQARYQQLLTLASEAYGIVLKAPAEATQAALVKEQGHITPKVGVGGALINSTGQIFLAKRKDDALWSLPCGWCDVNETPEQALCREFQEEVGWPVQISGLVNVFSRLPGEFNALHTSYHLVYLCELTTANPPELQLEPAELTEAGWFSLNHLQSLPWHREHETFARAALKSWHQRQSSVSQGDLRS